MYVVVLGLSATLVKIAFAIEYSVIEGPAYAPGEDPPSISEVVKTPVTAGEAAGAAGPVSDPRASVTEKPGGKTGGDAPVAEH